ncbi:MAG TPA: asparagine synthase (glutamine-hydrolyzing) [Candidatus Ratteibacteria bacterium]|uniref:asparagine synthase (glutamine-hydrolyzing) n=1 Tax=candidate division TA06 bacterium ADurb.Bin131 TaxID=1852827 RepID=A0A1V6C8Q1_UNCT6|nr:MAG: Asparagine synthetase (glutamine-hydrolyzing) 1 [candidate division TA06 bacterium ADurb.Bin131]HOC02264.1 asparagine synthase (glutamine-hydrolyzing) [bacterium]HRS05699.1 asparagine synthase (glutamine-hydrolyzing) [Candidatus Ratteibacteria bacterium]HON05126.1 asparagine synthase (glutamine-hydrolyzing) [bacterium]HOQ82184.1 asparagine synthase (glutamine-hydrolyzing) [bacterium]
MCGICGIVSKDKQVSQSVIQKMASVMDYRGPDDEGYSFFGNAGLGHRRLSVIDITGGHQPMSNEDGTLFLVCNGEIYNFKQLRDLLENKGHRIKTRSDNEIILHLYEEYKTECLKYLRGMFAFGIWDNRKKTLFLARDRLGKKPLVYSLYNEDLYFASEIKALLEVNEISREIDHTAIDLYLAYQAIPSPYTVFKKIKKLPPGHFLIWNNGSIDIRRYWHIDFTKKLKLSDENQYMEAMWEKLKESTKIRMVSDVPLGAFLSGGIDSSTIVGLMSEFSDHPVKTFSVGFEESDFSELQYARVVARRFNTSHNEFIVKPDIISILPKLVWHYNEPFGDSSMVPTYYVARETRKYVTVALNGDGGDENLAGYTRYWQTQVLEKIYNIYKKNPFLRKEILKFFVRQYNRHPSSTFNRIWKWLDDVEKSGFDYAYARRLIAFSNDLKNKFYSEEMKEKVQNSDCLALVRDIWSSAGDICLLEKMLATDFNLYLPDVLMVKMDIACMANSLEARSPFLDNEFVELMASFPADLKVRRMTSKYILKRKLKGFLPEEIISRKKMGFGIPVGRWFRKELKQFVNEILLDNASLSRGYFDPQAVMKMVEDHTSGRIDHTSRIWLLIILEMWHKIFVDRKNF